MDYMMLIYSNPDTWSGMSEEETRGVFGAYQAYTQALADAGVLRGGAPLDRVETATTVRVAKDGKQTVLDGPYADSKEQLGGYYWIDAPDLDAALKWAARCPGASLGAIEVRAIVTMPAPIAR